MFDTFRITTDERFYQVIMKFQKFADCKRFILSMSEKYDKDYLTGCNFLVKNGFYAVLFFDTEETNPEQLDLTVLELTEGQDYEIIKTNDDVFWINELVRQSEFSLLGNADSVLMTFPDVWKL
jgi:hypothetical protein